MKKSVLISFSLFISLSVFAQEKTTYPGESWEYVEVVTPCDPFQPLESYVRDSLNTTGMMIIQDGKIVFDFGDLVELSYLASARKSLLSILYGIYEDKGLINLESSLEELGIDEVTPLTDTEKEATIDQIINARSGIYLPAANAGSGPNPPSRGEYKPGEYFYYNNWDFNAAGGIFEKLVGKSLFKVFEEEIALPIGMEDFGYGNQRKYANPEVTNFPAYHFYLSTRDMARVGYLMLKNGKWEDKQIIPEDWIKKSTTKVSEPTDYGDMLTGYSYMWWILEESKHRNLEGAYTAAGAYGQYITVLPKLNMVIAHKTNDIYERSTSISDYGNLIMKLLESLDRAQNPNKAVDYGPFLGDYVDNSGPGDEMEIKIYEENDQLFIEAPIFPEPMELTFCDEIRAGFIGPEGDRYPLRFVINEDGNVNGFSVLGTFITKR